MSREFEVTEGMLDAYLEGAGQLGDRMAGIRAALTHPSFHAQLRAWAAEEMRGLVPEADDPSEYSGDWRLNDLKRAAEAEVDFRNETLANITAWEKEQQP